GIRVFHVTGVQTCALPIWTNVAVALRPWAQCASGPDDKCNNGAPPTFLRRSLPAGEYAIIVQASTGGGAFDLNLRIDPPTDIPPSGRAPGRARASSSRDAS